MRAAAEFAQKTSFAMEHFQPGVSLVWRFLPKVIRAETRTARRMFGGLWVGGEAVLTSTELRFSPNAMNEALHAKPETLSRAIRLADVVNIQVRRGVITNIIDVRSRTETLTLRCFKAAAFASRIDGARSLISKN